MKSVSIDYTRDDGDFAILATLSNKGGHMSDNAFQGLVCVNHVTLERLTGHNLQILEREDTPDYVEIEE